MGEPHQSKPSSNRLASEFSTLLMAWTYFTRLPLPKALAERINYSQQTLESCMRYLPLFGILIGGLAALVFWASYNLLDSKSISIVLSMITAIVATGALHEDGLADFFDAFGGSWHHKQRLLEIMKDSRIGTFGAVSLILTLLTKFQALSLVPLPLMITTLIAGHAFSRFACAAFLYTHDYARDNDQSFAKPMPKQRMGHRDFLILALFGLLPMTLFSDWRFLIVIPVLWIIRWLFGRWFTGKIGGYTGDCLGATQQIIELCFYIGVVAITTNL